MFKFRNYTKWFFLFIVPLVVFAWMVEASEELDFGVTKEEDNFKFSDHLDTSAAWMRAGSGKKTLGEWTSGRFLFPGVSSSAEIKKISRPKNAEGNAQQAISFNTIKNVKRVLEFKEVPSAETLKVSYGVLSEKAKGIPLSYVNFRIWLGQHKLSEFRLHNEAGWHDLEIPLGVYSFLDRPGIFRFELFSDSSHPISFSFEAELI